MAPVAGKVLHLSEADDEVFASKALGDGVVIEPSDGVAVAPFDGTIVTLFLPNMRLVWFHQTGQKYLYILELIRWN